MSTLLFRIRQRATALRRTDDGSTIVEFALVSVLFFTFVFGTMEFGRMVFAFNAISSAARDGVRWASVRGHDSGHVATEADIKNYVVSRSLGLLAPSNVTVFFFGHGLPPDNAAGDVVEVTTTYTFTPVVPLLPQSTRTMTSSARMVISR